MISVYPRMLGEDTPPKQSKSKYTIQKTPRTTRPRNDHTKFEKTAARSRNKSITSHFISKQKSKISYIFDVLINLFLFIGKTRIIII